MEVFVGTFAVAAIGAILAFAREQIKNSREDVEWYRNTLLPAVQNQQEIIEKAIEGLKQERKNNVE